MWESHLALQSRNGLLVLTGLHFQQVQVLVCQAQLTCSNVGVAKLPLEAVDLLSLGSHNLPASCHLHTMSSLQLQGSLHTRTLNPVFVDWKVQTPGQYTLST